MTSADLKPFLERLGALSELFRAELSTAVQQIYFEALRDLDLTVVLSAMNTLVGTSRFMPKPAEIRAVAVGDVEDNVESSWLLWRQAAARAGAYSSLLLEDPVLAETLVAVFGGWVAACQASFSDEMWAAKRKEWGRVYRSLARRGLAGARYLPGVIEQGNQAQFEDRSHPLAVIEAGMVKRIPAGDVASVKALSGATTPRHALAFVRVGDDEGRAD